MNNNTTEDNPSRPTLTDEEQLQQQQLVAALLQTLETVSSNNNNGQVEEGNHEGESSGCTFQCPCCDFVTTDRDELDVHAVEHEGSTFTCRECSFSSDRWGRYSRHLNKHAMLERTFTCNYCSYRTKTKGSYDAHMRTHTGEKPYACSFCPYRSAQRVHLKIHVRTHTGEKPFSCPHCPYQATQNSSLKRHVQTQHGPSSGRMSRRYNRFTAMQFNPLTTRNNLATLLPQTPLPNSSLPGAFLDNHPFMGKITTDQSGQPSPADGDPVVQQILRDHVQQQINNLLQLQFLDSSSLLKEKIFGAADKEQSKQLVDGGLKGNSAKENGTDATADGGSPFEQLAKAVLK